MKSVIGKVMVVRILAASLSTSSPEGGNIGHIAAPKVVREDRAENI